jgi:tetratricopeptide (TPR) repeat protein
MTKKLSASNFNLKASSKPIVISHDFSEIMNQVFALFQQGNISQAQAACDLVLQLQPKNFDALLLLGVIAGQSNNHSLAVKLLNRAIDINPSSFAAHLNIGLSLKALNRVEEAIVSYDKAILLMPELSDAHNNRGVALEELGRLKEAIDCYNQAITLNPNYTIAYCNRGIALSKMGMLEDAILSFDQSLVLDPNDAIAFADRGKALRKLGRHEDALEDFNNALELNPNFAQAYADKGLILMELGEVKDAIVCYDHAIALNPGYIEAKWNKSLALLVMGNFEDGLQLHELRWTNKQLKMRQRDYVQPLWLGRESLAGKTILLHAEQGFGDTIQFCRYAKMVQDLGAKVIIEAPTSLLSLLSVLDGVDDLVAVDSNLPVFDFHCPLLSLPFAFNTTIQTIPIALSYLSSNTLKRQYWLTRLGHQTKNRIGLVWSGNPSHANDHNRSLKLMNLLKELPDGFEYVSLQKEVRFEDQEALASAAIAHFGADLQDFSDTAALCDLMDLVITVDSSVAHLSAALGKPTWILLPYVPDWRWLLGRDDSPWYPSVKLYRQGADRKWDSVFNFISRDLLKLLH